MLNDMNWFIDNLENNIPFGFARFNDGEMGGIAEVGSTAARGDQRVDETLSVALKDALTHKQKNYYIGIPCSLCYPAYNQLALQLVGKYKYLTKAVVTTNRNWKKFIDLFPNAIKGKRVLWVGGDDQKVDELEKININIVKKGLIPRTNSWRYFEHIRKTFPNNFQSGDIVGISLGPTARVLVKEWFASMPAITFIDMGSNLDPYTRNIRHNCHKGWEDTGFNLTTPCAECN